MVTARKFANVAFVLLGGAAGYVVGPWLAVLKGAAPWWAPFAFYLAVGPMRWFPWLVAGSWVESAFVANAIGDAGASVGILQYNDGAAVKPKDRDSPFWSGFVAADYTVTTAARGGVSGFLTLRIPLLGYYAWRWGWRSGTSAPVQKTGTWLPKLLEGELGDRERKGLLIGLAVWLGLAVVVGIGRQAMARK